MYRIYIVKHIICALGVDYFYVKTDKLSGVNDRENCRIMHRNTLQIMFFLKRIL